MMRMGRYMTRMIAFYVSLLSLLLLPSSLMAQAPWDVNAPIVKVDRELYLEHYTDPETGDTAAAGANQRYVGPELERKEIVTWAAESDTPYNPLCRYSWDNGRNWTELEPMDPPEYISFLPGGERVFWAPGWAYAYDPIPQKTVAVWMHQIIPGDGRYYNHAYIRTSSDFGQTWDDPKQVTYETGGAAYNPEEPVSGTNDPLDPTFMQKNRIYAGQELSFRSDGALLFGGTSANVPTSVPMGDINPYNITSSYLPADSRNIGGIDLAGTWNGATEQYNWTSSNVAWVPRHVSSRGLLESSVAELTDGRLLSVYRGSNHNITGYNGGHKWYTLSTDGGATISDPLEWTAPASTPHRPFTT